MIKIKLTESRTLPVSRELVSQLEPLYKKGFLKLVEVFILDKIEGTKGSANSFYNTLLNNFYQAFPEVQGSNIPLDMSFLNSLLQQMNAEEKEERSLQISEVSIENLVKIFESDESNPLKTFLRGRMSIKQAVNKIKKYFKERNINSLGINIELQKVAEKKQREEETYSGLYLADVGAISVVFEASFFTDAILVSDDGRRLRLSPRLSVTAGKRPETIIDYIKDELEELPISIRHELQHFYQSLFSHVFGTADFAVGSVPRKILRRVADQPTEPDEDTPHFLHPVEMQTDIQDEIDKFHMNLKKFKKDNSNKSDMFPMAIKIMIKIFVGSELTLEEKGFARKHRLHHYLLNGSELFRNIKSKDKSGELYKYALSTLYTSVSDQLQESIVMDNIKIVLRESQVISENLTKEEIRKLIRDELAKMLKDKETKKEIADITKKFMKKLYRELSIDSTYIIDRIDT